MPRPLLALLLLATGLRLMLAATTGPGDDEAYYGLWAQHPALGYLDHPPLSFALMAASIGLLGPGPLALRLPSLLCGLGVGWLLWRLGRQLWPTQPARADLALLLWLCSPYFGLLTVFANPDMPLLLCLLGGLWSARDGQLRPWPMGLCLGMGLLCKYPAALLLLALPARSWLSLPGALALGLAALIYSPNLLWNIEEGGVSYAHQLWGRHGGGASPLERLGQLLGGQLGLIGLLGVGAVGGLLQLRREGGPLAASLWRLALGGLGWVLLAGPFTDAKPNWTAPGWLCALLPAALWLEGRPGWRRWTLASLLLVQLLALAQSQVRLLPLALDPTDDLYGAAEVARAVREELALAPDALVAAAMYQVAAQADWALPPEVEVDTLSGRLDQYDLWRATPLQPGRGVLWLEHDRYPSDPRRHGALEGCDLRREVEVRRNGQLVRRWRIWRCAAR